MEKKEIHNLQLWISVLFIKHTHSFGAECKLEKEKDLKMDLGLVLDSQKTGFETTSLYCTTEHKKYTSIYHCFTI